MFQSIAGSQKGNEAFGLDGKLIEEARQLALREAPPPAPTSCTSRPARAPSCPPRPTTGRPGGDGGAVGGSETFHFAYYYAPDYGSDYGGWLFWVDQWSQAEFENHLCAIDTSGVSCFARGCGWVLLRRPLPNGCQLLPGKQRGLSCCSGGIAGVGGDSVLAVNGVEPLRRRMFRPCAASPSSSRRPHHRHLLPLLRRQR